MTPNGYTYRYTKPAACQECWGVHKGATNKGVVYYLLWEYNGKKICRGCGKRNKIL